LRVRFSRFWTHFRYFMIILAENMVLMFRHPLPFQSRHGWTRYPPSFRHYEFTNSTFSLRELRLRPHNVETLLPLRFSKPRGKLGSDQACSHPLTGDPFASGTNSSLQIIKCSVTVLKYFRSWSLLRDNIRSSSSHASLNRLQ
jgi:hypothetical protein